MTTQQEQTTDVVSLHLIPDDGVFITADGEVVAKLPQDVPEDASDLPTLTSLAIWIAERLHVRESNLAAVNRRRTELSQLLKNMEGEALDQFHQRADVRSLEARIAQLDRVATRAESERDGILHRFGNALKSFVRLAAHKGKRSVDTEWGRLSLRKATDGIAILDNEAAVRLFTALELDSAIKRTAQVGAAKATLLLAYAEPDDLAPPQALAERDRVMAAIAAHPGAVAFVRGEDKLAFDAA